MIMLINKMIIPNIIFFMLYSVLSSYPFILKSSFLFLIFVSLHATESKFDALISYSFSSFSFNFVSIDLISNKEKGKNKTSSSSSNWEILSILIYVFFDSLRL